MAKKQDKVLLDLAVAFNGVSIGESTARIGVTVDRSLLELKRADELLCGRRLTGRILVRKKGDHDDQATLPGMEDTQFVAAVDGNFDVKRLGVSPGEYSAGLTFALPEIKVGDLAKFANRTGKLQVYSVEDLDDVSEE